MLKGEGNVKLSHLSIPFPSLCSIKGAYICVNRDESSSLLLFTFTLSDGTKTSKKYEFTRPKHEYECCSLDIDLDNVVLCEIQGKGKWKEKNSRVFEVNSLVFVRKEVFEALSSLQLHENRWADTPTITPEFIKPGNATFVPIPRDDSAVIVPSIVKGKDDSKSPESRYYDQSSNAQKMLEGKGDVILSHLSIRFPSAGSMKGAYICVDKGHCLLQLFFTFTNSDGMKTFKKYKFSKPKLDCEWYFLDIDLSTVVLCEIQGKGIASQNEIKNRYFKIVSLIFLESYFLFREPQFVQEGDFSCIPIPRDDPTIVNPVF
ncbi:hypothetical protein ADUPG1_000859, partial [Aduncisulcus paluster]